MLEGPQEKIEEFLDRLKDEKPPLSEIQDVNVNYSQTEGLEKFRILKSAAGGQGSGTIPPDTAMCGKCYADMRDPEIRYHNYWATSCVDCGPRFTVIRGLPYDRPRTSMDEFPMCEDCREEYEDPSDRRYHAQTIACPKCGPQLFSTPSNENPIKGAGEALKDEKIVAIKGIGGTHLACNAFNSEVVEKLKRRLQRLHKPLAIMAEDLDMVKKIAIISEKEKESLTSIKRPIVVLERAKDSPLTHEVSEGLHNVGVMLPYTGVHYLLFDHISFPVVMTSANLTGKPMLIENEKIISELDNIADFMLLHGRKIVARCDDSVIRFSGGTRRFLRRSRGWAPSPIRLDLGNETILALGAEFDNTIALYDDGNCYVSQHIGDVDDLETLNFLKQTIDHLTNITNLDTPNIVACDLHPDFLTTELAEDISEDPVRVQHHHSHLASLLGEKEIQEIVGIDADGVGFGPDGTIWGGEVLLATRSEYERLGSLSPMLMPGSDLASRHPSRMIAGIFYDSSDLSEILSEHATFPDGGEERRIVEKQVRKKFNSPVTTSAGRTLDAVSSLLGVSHERNYEGEPAMKLESFAVKGSPLDLEPSIKNLKGRLVVDVQSMFRRLIDLKEKGTRREDIAATAQNMLAKGLAQIAVRCAEERGVKNIGFTGGVAYNDAVGCKIREIVEGSGLNYYTNSDLPPGDGGVSFGQLIVAANA
ncbi:hypothetical protein AKJ51_03620 [candidate division MSBL1 archaeon SCGC-AAA382A20]|uniref:Carbamoyltransferase n=1 Tax=candidate division MSBL1 archaeon SCGC-AAA382A20 TaxID=1698280 RepID=A0A133VJC5_9EURY|nr:hypothetical protein AKJ51_03620 [candidate division MSBL1 archaeon SCGC-AAA382A20]